MATEQAQTLSTESGSLAKWASWVAALVGLWVLVSPFALAGDITGGAPMASNVIAGLVILVLSAFGAYALRTTTPDENTPGEIGAWIAAIAGIWILAAPFVLSGAIGTGTAMSGNVVAGGLALLLAGYAGWQLHEPG